MIDTAVAFYILAEIPSGPFDFVVSKLDARFNTSSSEQHKFSGKSLVVERSLGQEEEVNG